MTQKDGKSATTTQTGEDGLCTRSKQEALEYLKDIWHISPRWIPQSLGIIDYPFISASEFEGIAGPNCPLSAEYRHLLDLQKQKGRLEYADMPKEKLSGEDHLDLVGTHDGTGESGYFLLDPLAGKFLHIPDTESGIRKYNEFYRARMGYIEALSNAYDIIPRENPYNLPTLTDVPVVDLFARNVVIICGLGTAGGETSIRIGKQMPGVHLALIDGGIFGPENVDRQVCGPGDIGINKALKVAGTIYATNPMLPSPVCVPFHLSEENMEETLNSIIRRHGQDDPPLIQIIDAIDITERSTLLAKALLHETIIKMAGKLKQPIYVHWSIDIGASGDIVGTCRYTGNEKHPFNGRYTRRHAELPPMLAISELIPNQAGGLDVIEDLRKRFRSGGQMRHVSQTGLSAIGAAKGVATRVILTALGYGPSLNERTSKDDVRESLTVVARSLASVKRLAAAIVLSMMVRIKTAISLRNHDKKKLPVTDQPCTDGTGA